MIFQDESYKNWEDRFDKLENDFDSFRDYFDRNKKCQCHIDECQHFDNALENVLGERTDNLFQLRLDIGFKRYRA